MPQSRQCSLCSPYLTMGHHSQVFLFFCSNSCCSCFTGLLAAHNKLQQPSGSCDLCQSIFWAAWDQECASQMASDSSMNCPCSSLFRWWCPPISSSFLGFPFFNLSSLVNSLFPAKSPCNCVALGLLVEGSEGVHNAGGSLNTAPQRVVRHSTCCSSHWGESPSILYHQPLEGCSRGEKTMSPPRKAAGLFC